MHNRREAIKKVLAGSAVFTAAGMVSACAQQQQEEEIAMKNNIRHSVCRWTYGDMPLDELCCTIKDIGFAAIDLVGPDDRTVLKEHGVESSMCNGAEISLEDGWAEKVNHPDYMADRTYFGAELCKRLGAENSKLLNDICHMQVDEGDIIRTIRDNHQYIGHYHTAGVPGRHEIDESQELYYTAIMRVILKTGFKGYVAQEFIPAQDDKVASLRQAISICDV